MRFYAECDYCHDQIEFYSELDIPCYFNCDSCGESICEACSEEHEGEVICERCFERVLNQLDEEGLTTPQVP